MDFEQFTKECVVPDVIPTVPRQILQIKYDSGVEVEMGNELTPTQVKDVPTVTWEAEPNALYSLIFIDPDAPSRQKPRPGEFKHWLVINIPGNQVDKGDVAADYIGSGPPEGSGLHRYCFLLYKQNGRLNAEPTVSNTSIKGRMKWRASAWAQSHQMTLIAGNFYQAQYDEYVKVMMKKFLGCLYPFFVGLRAIGIL
ncbi:unnamed protein product, partial [Mesorhabditis belari]|uniref:Phosphatidylethanolamine-binding protein n=1 Tax=Mesorhabditis belari TaxID=2138241 RepID=A0AAF3EGY4_9BILA